MVIFVYKFKRIVGKPNFRDQFKKIVKRYTGPDPDIAPLGGHQFRRGVKGAA